MLFSLVDDWSCDSFGKRVFLRATCCNRDSFSSSVVLWIRGLTIRGYALLYDSLGNGWDAWIRSAHWWGRYLLGAVNWISVNARTRRMKGATHLGHARRADQCTLCEGSRPSRISLIRPKDDSSCIYIRPGSLSRQEGTKGSQVEWRCIPQL